jgi:hypothetical protein
MVTLAAAIRFSFFASFLFRAGIALTYSDFGT